MTKATHWNNVTLTCVNESDHVSLTVMVEDVTGLGCVGSVMAAYFKFVLSW